MKNKNDQIIDKINDEYKFTISTLKDCFDDSVYPNLKSQIKRAYFDNKLQSLLDQNELYIGQVYLNYSEVPIIFGSEETIVRKSDKSIAYQLKNEDKDNVDLHYIHSKVDYIINEYNQYILQKMKELTKIADAKLNVDYTQSKIFIISKY